jgi:hypothetical protein
MLQAGFEWLEKHNKSKLKTITYKGIYGILEPKSKDAKELSKIICNVCPDCTGAMHQAVMSHLMYISANGLDKWKNELKKQEIEERKEKKHERN